MKNLDYKTILAVVLVACAMSISASADSGKLKKKVEAVPAAAQKTYSYVKSKLTSFEHEGSVSMTKGTITMASGASNFDLGADYHWYIKDNFQAGFQASMLTVSGGGASYTVTSIFGMGTYNFDEDFANSMFVRGGIGFASGSAGGSSQTKVAFKVGFGKRFPLWDHFYYAPNGGIAKYGDLDAQVELMPVNFSVFY